MAMNPFMGMGDPSRRIGGPAPVPGYGRPTQPSPWFGMGQPKPPTISGQPTPWSQPAKQTPGPMKFQTIQKPETDLEELERTYLKQMGEFQSKTAPYAQEFQSRYGTPATEEYLSAYADRPMSPIELSMNPYQLRRFERYGFDPRNWEHNKYKQQMASRDKPRMFSL